MERKNKIKVSLVALLLPNTLLGLLGQFSPPNGVVEVSIAFLCLHSGTKHNWVRMKYD